MKKIAFTAILLAILACGPVRAEEGRGIIVQVTDEQKLNMALTNAINTTKMMPGVPLEVVVYGPAISMLTAETTYAQKIDAAREHGVHIVACEASMKGNHLARGDMYPGLDYVPFGLTEIVQRQFRGWAYARP